MAPPKTRTSIGARAPINEIGGVLNGTFSPAGMAPWSMFVDDQEFVAELRWPASVRTYERMATDSQVAALFQATVLALLKFQWKLNPNGADEAQVIKLSKDYNLPIQGEEGQNSRRRPTEARRKGRFSFRDHLRKSMLAGRYGHYYFEQTGFIGDDGLWHLKKLAERPPHTIADFRIAQDGGLVSIIQNVTGSSSLQWGSVPEIPVDRLVGYVWDKEGANWAGRSWFRELYKNWLIKDRLMRIDAVNHERAGGVPYIEAHPGATFNEIKQLNEMAQSFRIGDTAGGAVPAGAKFQIARGTNSSVVESMKYHDEAMARKFMLMIMQLGQTKTGSRALGTTFVDFWGGGLEAIAHWYSDVFNEHVIEDDIDWNYGDQVEQVPILTYEFDPELVVDEVVKLIVAKAIQVDDDLEDALRKELGLPVRSTPRLPATDSSNAPNPTEPPPSDPQAGNGAPTGQQAVQARAGERGEAAPSGLVASALAIPATTEEEE
jgi:hypothetical protein